jgi:hypothetical protein|nr:MAG TPA: hypothetical protein [Caudoviricetes sp.]
MKQYKLSHLSYDFLAQNKTLITYAARYTFQQEVRRDGRRYIIAKREVFGEIIGETVRVVIRYD